LRIARQRVRRHSADKRGLDRPVDTRGASRPLPLHQPKVHPKAFNDLNWLLERAEELAEHRNNAVHAPCSPYLNADGSTEVKAAYLSAHQRHPRAARLMGKDLLVEFAWCAWYASTLSRFTQILRMAIGAPGRYEWPERPKIPRRADFSGESRRSIVC
jgi:hypothetical protein